MNRLCGKPKLRHHELELSHTWELCISDLNYNYFFVPEHTETFYYCQIFMTTPSQFSFVTSYGVKDPQFKKRGSVGQHIRRKAPRNFHRVTLGKLPMGSQSRRGRLGGKGETEARSMVPRVSEYLGHSSSSYAPFKARGCFERGSWTEIHEPRSEDIRFLTG